MTTQEKKEEPKKEYDYDNVVISLENSILPSEKLDETPSMKDGLDRDTENDLRIYGCELIQIAGLLLKLPQVAMGAGQILLQRFYFSKSLVKHDVEVYAMASVFLAAKIEECPRRLRDIINVCHHIKQKLLQKPVTPMDYFSTQYHNMKTAIIKAERRILKELGFCVHVKHPHKLIITYLQMLDSEKNVALARKAWNYMNDSLRTDVFVRFEPEIIACACIFLAARTVKINLPLRPPWWELFDAQYDDIEDIALSILRLYAKPRRKVSKLEASVNKLKKALVEKKDAAPSQNQSPAGSFTPSHTTSSANTTTSTLQNSKLSDSSKPASKNNSPNPEKKRSLNSVVSTKKTERQDEQKNHNANRRREGESETSGSSSDSGEELPSKKYAQQRRQYENDKRRPSSSDSEDEREPLPSKIHRNDSPKELRKKDRAKEQDKSKESYNRDKGQYRNNDYNSKPTKRRSRSRSPVKRIVRSPSPVSKKDKYLKDKNRTKSKDKYYDKYYDKYSEKYSDKYVKVRR